VVILYLLAATLGAGLAYQALGSYLDSRRFPPPGRIIDIGSSRLHLDQQGTGNPVVVLESGIASTSLAWALVQPQIAAFTRVISYDRAGLGWSAAYTPQRTVQEMVSQLAALLSAANLPAPYILVGHSFGALLIRAYAHLRPREVAGLVFVDPVCISCWARCAPDELRRLQIGTKLSRRGALLARFGIVRAALAMLASGGRRLPNLIARASAPRAASLMSNLVGQVQKLPPALWPVVRSHWSNPKCFRGMAAYLESLPGAARAVSGMPVPPHIPFVILSASNATPAELEERNAWTRQNPLATHVLVENTGHWIQLEHPEAVVSAVRNLVAATTKGLSIAGCSSK
jgi:pimeloyl-ACP methyl ester carboxylesterase